MKAVGRALRKHLSPLGGDTVTMLNLPPVRMGLLTKLNLLTIGLIFLTAVAITAYHFTQQWREDVQQLKTQGASMLGIMAELAEYGIYTSDRAYLSTDARQPEPGPGRRVRHGARQKQQVLVERRFAPALAKSALPALPADRLVFASRAHRQRRRSRSTACASSNSSHRFPARWPQRATLPAARWRQ